MDESDKKKLEAKNFVDVDEYKIHYEVVGNGSSVVLVLPGGFGMFIF